MQSDGSNGLYKVELDQRLAKELLKIGGFLLLLDIPAGTIVGLDRQVELWPCFYGWCTMLLHIDLTLKTLILDSASALGYPSCWRRCQITNVYVLTAHATLHQPLQQNMIWYDVTLYKGHRSVSCFSWRGMAQLSKAMMPCNHTLFQKNDRYCRVNFNAFRWLQVWMNP